MIAKPRMVLAVDPSSDDLPPPEQTHDEWLASYDPNVWKEDRLTMAADVVTLSVVDGRLSTLLLRRTEWPEHGSWVVPGAFRRRGERFGDTARRVVEDKLRIRRGGSLIHLTFRDRPDRDPRDVVGSVGYMCLCSPIVARAAAQHQYVELGVISGDKVQLNDKYVELGFDHEEIVSDACNEARRRLQVDPLWIVPGLSDDNTFTVAQLNQARRTLGLAMTDDALRRRIATDDRTQPAGWVDTGSGKPSRLYRAAL